MVNFYAAILVLKMEENNALFIQHITYTTYLWCIVLYYCKKGKNATETQKKICAVYGEGAVTY